MNSYRELNQIFYNNNKFDSPTDILKLEPLFFSLSKHEMEMTEKENIEIDNLSLGKGVEFLNKKEYVIETISTCDNYCETSISSPITKTFSENSNIKENEKLNKKWFEPLQKDTIFWCIFAFIYGHTEYLMIGSRYGNRELEEKGKMITYFNESKKELKNINHKITNGNIQEILSEFLALQNETTFLGIIGLAVFYKIRILLVDETKKMYIDFHIVDHTDAKTCILYKNTSIKGTTMKGKGQIKYRMNMEVDSCEDEILRIQTNMLRLEHFTKPLRAISSYKLSELEEIAKMIGLFSVSSNNKLKKPELYASITEYCNWNT